MTEQNKPEVQKNPNSEVTNPSEVRFRAVVDGFSDPILMLDEYRIVRYANHEFLHFFGYQLADVIGVPIEQLLPVHDRQEFVEHFETGLPTAARKLIFEHHLLRRDNGQEIVETTVNPLNDPTGQGTFLLHIHVITERKRAENELRELNAELEQRVAARTHELHQSNLELQHANRAKDEFLAMMSHELRTPLNSILGLSEILLDEMRGPLGDYQRRALQTIEASGQHLLQLINDILDLSKIEAGQSEFFPQPVEVDEICSASLAFVKAQALKKFIEVTYLNEAGVTHILADTRRLKQILVNLLTNAVKFTPENGSVTLKVQTDLERNLIHSPYAVLSKL